MSTPLLTIGLLHGSLDGDVAKVRIAVGQKTLAQCYISAADLMKCLTGLATPCVLTIEEANELMERTS